MHMRHPSRDKRKQKASLRSSGFVSSIDAAEERPSGGNQYPWVPDGPATGAVSSWSSSVLAVWVEAETG